MKGLIVKDLLTLKPQLNIIIVLLIMYTVMAVSSNEGPEIFMMVAIIFNMIAVTNFSQCDEVCDWDTFGGALPVGRKKTVIARYLSDLSIIGITLVMILAVQILVFISGKRVMQLSYFTFTISIGLFTSAVVNPVLYKFGYKKSRFVIVIICLIPSLIILMFNKLNFNPTNTAIPTFSLISLNTIVFLLFGVCFIFYIISILVSILIYQKKVF